MRDERTDQQAIEAVFGPVAAPRRASPQEAKSQGVVVAGLLGGALCVVLGAAYALFAMKVGALFSIANIGVGVLLGRVIRARIGEHNRGLAPLMAAIYTYVAGAMVFLPDVLAVANALEDDLAAHRESLEWVRGAMSNQSSVSAVTIVGLVLRAPVLMATANSPLPLVFIGIGVFYAVKEASVEAAT